METYLHGPMDFAKNAETAISCMWPEPARKKKEVPGIPVAGTRRKQMHRCARVAMQERV